jgi:hypothetical protein
LRRENAKKDYRLPRRLVAPKRSEGGSLGEGGFLWPLTSDICLELEPVLHTGEGPLAYRTTGIPAEQAKALINELL